MNDSRPLVSIKIASYNHSKYIRQTIQSVLDQTYQNFEIIIVDDFSTDDSVEIIKTFKDARITLLVNDKNLGAPATSKRAKPLCKGKYFCSLDSDDYFAVDKLEKQVQYLEEHPDADLIASRVYEVDGEGNTPSEQIHANWFNVDVDLNAPETWLSGNHVCHSSVLMKRTIHDELWDYDSGLHYTGDYYNWVLFFVHGVKFHVTPEKLTYYRFHGENVTHKAPGRSYWERAFIAGKQLIPYLLRIERQDLIVKGMLNYLFNEHYPSDTPKQHLLLNLLLNQSGETTDFEKIWEKYGDRGDQIAFPLHNLIIEELRDEWAKLTSAWEQRGTWIEKLEEGRQWLASQNEQLQVLIGQKEAMLSDQKAWIEKLEEDKQWLEEQWKNWKKLADERHAYIMELEKGKSWLEEQYHNWKKLAEDKELLIRESIKKQGIHEK